MKIQKDTTITLTLTHSGCLTLQMGEKSAIELAVGLPHHVYPVFDLYGKCEKISMFDGFDLANGTPINEEVSMATANLINSDSDADRNVPQCEKADLEVHEKETESSLPSGCCGSGSGAM